MTEIPAGMLETKRRLEGELLSRPGVSGVAVGLAEQDGKPTGNLAIQIFVEPGHWVRGELPESLEGHPVSVIECRMITGIETLTRPAPPAASMEDKYDPLVGGISIGPCMGAEFHGGTLGAVVIDNETGGPMLLSNYHVPAVRKDWPADRGVSQPWWRPCSDAQVGTLSRAKLDEHVDAAVAKQTGRGFDWEIEGIGPLNGTATAALGGPVRKRGFTTGLTSGLISSVDWSMYVTTPDGQQLMTRQIRIWGEQRFMDLGDSGLVIVDGPGRAVGLGCAVDAVDRNYAMANPIDEVTKAMRITIPGEKNNLLIENKKTLSETTSAAPVLATAAGRSLLLAWPGATDQQINIAVSPDGTSFKKTTLPQHAKGAPAIALSGSPFPDFIAWTDTDSSGTVHIAVLAGDLSIQDDRPQEAYSPGPPALLVRRDMTLVLAWTDKDSALHLATSSDAGKPPVRQPGDGPRKQLERAVARRRRRQDVPALGRIGAALDRGGHARSVPDRRARRPGHRPMPGPSGAGLSRQAGARLARSRVRQGPDRGEPVPGGHELQGSGHPR
jgi:hypothetical protein